MTPLKKIAVGALGALILSAIVVGFSLVGSELYRTLAGSGDRARPDRDTRAEMHEPDEPGDSRGLRSRPSRDERGDLDPIRVQVLDPALRPLADAPVRLNVSGHPPFETLREERTDADGMIVFDDLARDRYGVAVDVDPYVPVANTHVFPGESVRIELGEGGPLHGVVRDSVSGEALAGVEVRGTTRDLEPVRWNEATVTDAQGRYRFDAVSARTLSVHFSHPGFQHQHVKDLDVPVSPEGRTLDVELVPGVSITGWVTDADTGEPIPGAKISHGFGIFEENEVVRCDERGKFVLDGIGRGKIMVRARAEGYAPGRAHLDLRGVRSDETVQIELARWTTVAGSVRDDRGEPVEGAEIFLEEQTLVFSKSSRRLGLSAADGSFEANLEHVLGDVRLRARHPDFTEGMSEAFRVQPGVRVTGVDIRLQVGGRIVGNVSDEEGEPIAGARIHLYEEPRKTVENPADKFEGRFAARPRGRVLVSATTERDGSFEMRGIPDGPKILEIRAEGFLGHVEPGLGVAGGDVVGPLAFTLVRGRGIGGRVTDSSGKPLDGVRVSVLRANGAREGGSGSAITDAKGRFEVTDLGPGSFKVFATKSGFVRHDEAEIRAGTRDLQIALDRYGGIRGSVFFPDTAPGRFEVLLQDLALDEADAAPELKKAFSSRKGDFKLDTVAPGTYELIVLAEGYLPTRVGPLTVDENRLLEGIEVMLDGGALIVGRVFDEAGDPVRNADVFVRYLGEGDPRVTRSVTGPVRSDSEGAYRVSGLAGGRYEVLASRDRMATPAAMVIFVGDGEQVTLDLTMATGAELKLRVVDRDGNPVPEAAVEIAGNDEGDVLRPRSLRIASKYANDPGALRNALDRLNRTDVTGFLRLPTLPAGRYTIRAEHPEAGRGRAVVRLGAGETRSVQLVLE